jgi:hypothetical protein
VSSSVVDVLLELDVLSSVVEVLLLGLDVLLGLDMLSVGEEEDVPWSASMLVPGWAVW